MELKQGLRTYLIVGSVGYNLKIINIFQDNIKAEMFLEEVKDNEDYKSINITSICYDSYYPYVVLMSKSDDRPYRYITDLCDLDCVCYHTEKEAEIFVEGLTYANEYYVTDIYDIEDYAYFKIED